MFFSVIIPVYNRPEPVKFAIQSVLNQTYQDWECIVVDDASTDCTPQVCAELADSDSRIHFYSLSKNGGVSMARNYGLDHISNREDGYILFLDSDNRLTSNTMSTLKEVIEKNPVDMVVFAYDQQGLPFEPPYHQMLDRTWIRNRILPQHLNILPQSAGFLEPYVWNKCYKKTLISDHFIRFDEWRRVWEDNAFVIQCLDKCSEIILIPDNLYETCDYPGIDHLSGHVDADLFLNYIAGYEKNVEQFSEEYNYHNNYTPRRFFNVVHGLLITYYKKCDEKAGYDLLHKLLENRTMNEWVNQIIPANPEERRIVSAFQSGDNLALAQIYHKLSERQSEVKQSAFSWKGKLKQRVRKMLGDDKYDRIKQMLS